MRFIEEEEMSDMCRHQREKLLGIPQTGACHVCAPWMFPSRERIEASAKAIEAWRDSFPYASVDPNVVAVPTPEQRRRRLLYRKWNRPRGTRATA